MDNSYRRKLGLRRFEIVDGQSSNVWQVSCTECELTIDFGRICAAGQNKRRRLDEPAQAKAERDQLIRENTRKGYQEVAVPE